MLKLTNEKNGMQIWYANVLRCVGYVGRYGGSLETHLGMCHSNTVHLGLIVKGKTDRLIQTQHLQRCGHIKEQSEEPPSFVRG